MKEEILNEINSISKNKENFKPHKHLILLTVAKLFESPSFRQKEIFYNDYFVNIFTELFKKYAINDDSNRPHTPFFHLKKYSFWKLMAVSGREDELENSSTVGSRGRLDYLVKYALISDELYDVLSNEKERLYFSSYIVNILYERKISFLSPHKKKIDSIQSIEPSQTQCFSLHETKEAELLYEGSGNDPMIPLSRFISYINSLHCIDANSHGALAEAQASSPMFHEIYVKHPLTDVLASSLQDPSDRRHVVLTGHAGDGKSTIALELCKILTGRTEQASLADGFPKRVDVPGGISIVKDLSEWTSKEQDGLLGEMAAGGRRLLLVSNTGCLLNLLRRQASALGFPPMDMEAALLTALDASDGATLATKAGPIAIHNLARHDNVDLALEMLKRLANSQRWEGCRRCAFQTGCPVTKNLTIFRQRQTLVMERLRLLLRRTTDYGSRMTMRQLGAHFAYMLTSGLSCEAVADVLRKKQSFRLEEHLFFNRFWGDSGWSKDVRAAQLQSCRLIRAQGFGTVLAPSMERMLWQKPGAAGLDLGAPELTDMTKRLLDAARKRLPAPGHAQARMQIRRMAYFLLEHSPVLPQTDKFLGAFLNSPMLCALQGWLRDSQQLGQQRNALKNQLLHVLLEQFSGIRLPGGAAADATLHIALSRRQRGIRQNAQVLLGKIDFNDKFDVRIQPRSDGSAELVLIGKEELGSLEMRLDLPLLDYIAARQSGAVGSILQSSYANRLESLKASLLRHCSRPEADELVLLKLDAGSRPRRLRVAMSERGLEVANG